MLRYNAFNILSKHNNSESFMRENKFCCHNLKCCCSIKKYVIYGIWREFLGKFLKKIHVIFGEIQVNLPWERAEKNQCKSNFLNSCHQILAMKFYDTNWLDIYSLKKSKCCRRYCFNYLEKLNFLPAQSPYIVDLQKGT